MKNKKGKYFFFYCLIFLFMLLTGEESYAQDTAILNLQKIIETIETVYPDVMKYESTIQSLQAKVEGSKAWMPPIASFGLNQFPYDPMMLKDEGPMNQAGLMFTVEQMIPNAGKLQAKKDYLSSLPQIEQNKKEWTKNTLRLYAKHFYYQRVVAERKSQVVDENMELLQLLIKSTEEKYTYNQSDLNSVFKARAKLEDLKNMDVMLQSVIAESNIGLNTLMNRDVNTAFPIDTTIIMKSYEDLHLVSDTSLLKRNDIIVMQNTINSMKRNKDYMYSLRKPDLGVSVTHMQMFGMPNQYSVMGMITIPIVPWSSKMYKSDVKAMNFEIQSMTFEKQTMQLMAIQMINEKGTMLKYQIEQLKNYESAIIPLYSKNLEIGLLAFKQNTGSFFILLDAWEMLLMKKMEHNNVLLTTLKLQAEYEYEIEKK